MREGSSLRDEPFPFKLKRDKKRAMPERTPLVNHAFCLLEAELNAKAYVTVAEAKFRKYAYAGTIVQRESNRNIGDFVLKSDYSLNANTNLCVLFEVPSAYIAAKAIVEVETISDNGSLPLVEHLQTSIVGPTKVDAELKSVSTQVFLDSQTCVCTTATYSNCPVVVLSVNCQS